MDETHSIEENLEKIQALIDAVQRLYKTSNDMTYAAIVFQLESLRTLSNETFESLETIRNILLQQKK